MCIIYIYIYRERERERERAERERERDTERECVCGGGGGAKSRPSTCYSLHPGADPPHGPSAGPISRSPARRCSRLSPLIGIQP